MTVMTRTPGVGPLRPHTVYSSLRWFAVRERGGRMPDAYVTGPGANSFPVGLLPISRRLSSNPRYQLSHLMRGIPWPSASSSPHFAGTMSGYQLDLPTVTSVKAEPAATALLADARRIIGDAETLIIPYMTTAAANLISRTPSVQILLEGVDAWLDVPSCSFDEYVESLRADFRRSARKDHAAFEHSKFSANSEPLRNCISEFAGLIVENSTKYGLSFTKEDMISYLNIIAETFGDDALIFTARKRGELVGGTLWLIHQNILYLRDVGFNYSAVGASNAYFILTFHLPMRYAITLCLDRIHLGLSVDRTKRTRGGRLEPLWTALINARLSGAAVETVNANRLFALRDVIGPRRLSQFTSQVREVIAPSAATTLTYQMR